jgi:hypothetical protein
MVRKSLHVEYNWFKREDYLPISSFNLADWAAMLQVRCNFEHASAPDRKHHLTPDAAKKLTFTSDEKRRLRPIWDEYLRVALPCNYRKVPPQARTLPLLEDITAQIARLGKDQAAIHFGVRFLRVNRLVPDKHLKQAFDNWLRQSRISAPRGVSRRGRPSSNITITSQHLKSWTAYNILGVMDLDVCATLFGFRRLSHEKLCDYLIDPEKVGDVGPKDWGREARRKAEEAKESLDLLIAQAASQAEPAR